MPREHVRSRDAGMIEGIGPEDPIDNTTYENERAIAEVRWNKEAGHVQVVTRKKGYEVCPFGEEASYAYGMYITLERQEINDLIRILRKARDQAFGRDE